MSLRASLLAAGLLVVGASTGWAVVAPSTSNPAEITLPTDVPSGVFNVDVQASMSASSAELQNFVAKYGDWSVPVWNETSGSPRRAVGEPIPLVGAGVSGPAAEMAARAFIDENADLFNVSSDELQFVDARVRRGVTYMFFQQVVDGVPVYDASVYLRIDADGRVNVFGSAAHSDITISTTPSLSANEARSAATAGLTLADDDVAEHKGLVVMPVEWESGYGFFLTHHVEIETSEDGFTAYVNATNGDILMRKSHTMHVDIEGNVNGLVPIDDKPGGPYENRAFAFNRVRETVSSDFDHTDVGGDFLIPWTGTTDVGLQVELDSGNLNFNVANQGTDANLVEIVTPGVFEQLTFDDSNSLLEERASFEALNLQRYDLAQMDGAFPFGQTLVAATTNYPGSCNAQWTGSGIRLFAAGGGCISTGRIPSVGNHEYGHGLTQWMYSPFSVACAMVEGLPDVRAHNHTGVSTIGTDWRGPGTTIRDGENTRTWSQILAICPGSDYGAGDCHCKADITNGATWKARKNLIAKHGQVLGEQIAEETNSFSLYARPQSPQVYIVDILVEDDNDGNLNNGTPNYDEICAGFDVHEIACPAITEYITISHTELGDTTDDVNPYNVFAIIQGFNETVDVSQVFVNYRVDGGTFSSIAMTSTGPSTYEADIPAQALDSYVDYYISATGVGGATATAPDRAPLDLYTFVVGTLVTVLDDDMETDIGWIDNPGGADTAIDGYWVLDDPNGTTDGTEQANPENDATGGAGVQCWFTGQGPVGGSPFTDDVDAGCVSLDSPVQVLGGYKYARLTFRAWFFNSWADSDALTLYMSGDGGSTFTEIWSLSGIENSWNFVTVDLRDVDTPLTSNTVFRFTACDEGSGGTVEAAVDEFLVQRISGSAVDVDDAAAPAKFLVHQNRPNPFNPLTTLSYDVPASSDVSVRIYNVSGQLVRTLVSQSRAAAGTYAVQWDGTDTAGLSVASGTYYYEVRAGAEVQKRKMTLLK